jgi:hypothetical protein
VDEAVQGTAELHGLLGGQIDRNHVDHPEGKVSNEAGVVLPLGDDTRWAHMEVLEVLDTGPGKDNPLAAVNKVCKLFYPEDPTAAKGSSRKVRKTMGRGLFQLSPFSILLAHSMKLGEGNLRVEVSWSVVIQVAISLWK